MDFEQEYNPPVEHRVQPGLIPPIQVSQQGERIHPSSTLFEPLVEYALLYPLRSCWAG